MKQYRSIFGCQHSDRTKRCIKRVTTAFFAGLLALSTLTCTFRTDQCHAAQYRDIRTDSMQERNREHESKDIADAMFRIMFVSGFRPADYRYDGRTVCYDIKTGKPCVRSTLIWFLFRHKTGNMQTIADMKAASLWSVITSKCFGNNPEISARRLKNENPDGYQLTESSANRRCIYETETAKKRQ